MAEDQLIEAVHRGAVMAAAELLAASDPHHELTDRVLACGARIAEELASTRDEIVGALGAAAITAAPVPPPHPPQHHTLTLRVDHVAAAHRAATVLEPLGFERWDTWTGGAAISFDRHAHHLTVARTGDHTVVARIAWSDPTPRRPIERLVRPTHGDWATLTLPVWLWWAYPGVRIVRLAAERLRLRARHPKSLGPFLATPRALLEPLLAVAGSRPGALVIDLGCGDGRLAIAAALAGCRAIGVERDPDLAERARAAASDAGVTDRVTITTGDARDLDLGAADVVFAFLPPAVLAELLPGILAALRPGARVVAHEQSRLPDDAPAPATSALVVADAALTVAHRWDA